MVCWLLGDTLKAPLLPSESQQGSHRRLLQQATLPIPSSGAFLSPDLFLGLAHQALLCEEY